ncbi:MAG TPA: hypothetical protein VHL53_07915, partial [Acidimicrobiia bacterium]|nr:hypothetical protein [Acidimicrobiia bacterium]
MLINDAMEVGGTMDNRQTQRRKRVGARPAVALMAAVLVAGGCGSRLTHEQLVAQWDGPAATAAGGVSADPGGSPPAGAFGASTGGDSAMPGGSAAPNAAGSSALGSNGAGSDAAG